MHGKRIVRRVAARLRAGRRVAARRQAGGTARERARLLVTPAVLALVEPVVHAGAAPEPVVKGSMDRIVMRNVLSLAYMPRARACYLTVRARRRRCAI